VVVGEITAAGSNGGPGSPVPPLKTSTSAAVVIAAMATIRRTVKSLRITPKIRSSAAFDPGYGSISTRAASKAASSSSGMEYVCSLPGNAPERTSAA